MCHAVAGITPSLLEQFDSFWCVASHCEGLCGNVDDCNGEWRPRRSSYCATFHQSWKRSIVARVGPWKVNVAAGDGKRL